MREERWPDSPCRQVESSTDSRKVEKSGLVPLRQPAAPWLSDSGFKLDAEFPPECKTLWNANTRCMRACMYVFVGMYSCTSCVHALGLINRHFCSSGTSTILSTKGWFPLSSWRIIGPPRLDEAPTELLHAMNEALWVCVCSWEYVQIRVSVRGPSESACLQSWSEYSVDRYCA